MICKQCNNILNDDACICDACGFKARLAIERDKLEELKEKQRGQAAAGCREILFLIFTICFTVMTVGSAASVLGGNLADALSAVFMIISTVGLWRAYFARDAKTLAASLRDASIFDAFCRVMQTVAAVVTGILFFVLASVIFLVSMGDISHEMIEEIIDPDTCFALGVAVMVIGFLIVVLILYFRSIYRDRRRYFLSLAEYAQTGKYTSAAPGVMGSFAIGAANALSGMAQIAMSALSGSLTAAFIALMSNLLSKGGVAEADGIVAAAQAVLVAVLAGMGVKGFAELTVGVYYILSAVWMTKIHREATDLRSKAERQQVIRLEWERKSSAAYEEFKKNVAATAQEQADVKKEDPTVEEITEENAKENTDEEILMN